MHLYALSKDGEVILARQAEKQVDYSCLECHAPVRVREAVSRQPHFFHLSFSPCRQNGKSLTHICVQMHFQQLLKEEIALEVPFKTIGRIADVVWERKKLIFEIQCSFISKQEVTERNSDYLSLGYETIWILHDQRYNQKRISSCEQGLRNALHYFTNIDAQGKGVIYDQWQWVERGLRKLQLAPLAINIAQPIRFEKSKKCGQVFRKTGFEGDFCSLISGHVYFREAQTMEKKLTTQLSLFWKILTKAKSIVRSLWHAWIKKHCSQSR